MAERRFCGNASKLSRRFISHSKRSSVNTYTFVEIYFVNLFLVVWVFCLGFLLWKKRNLRGYSYA